MKCIDSTLSVQWGDEFLSTVSRLFSYKLNDIESSDIRQDKRSWVDKWWVSIDKVRLSCFVILVLIIIVAYMGMFIVFKLASEMLFLYLEQNNTR